MEHIDSSKTYGKRWRKAIRRKEAKRRLSPWYFLTEEATLNDMIICLTCVTIFIQAWRYFV